MISVRVLSLDRKLLAVLDRVNDPRYSRRPREATEITVSVPRGDTKLGSAGGHPAQRGRLLEVWRNGIREASGRIEIRDATEQHLILTAYTEEVALKDFVTPAQYGLVLNDLDAADAIKACLEPWEVLRVKTSEEWDDAVSSSNVEAWDADGGTLWLERDNEGKYKRAGHAIYQFNASSVPDFSRWERIRWESDYPPDAAVFTTIQWREGTSGQWLPDVSWDSCEECDAPQTIEGERGVLTGEVGLAITSTAPVIQVRVNLYSDDTDSQEDEEEGTSGSSPRFYALEVIARRSSVAHLAPDYPDDLGVTTVGIHADNSPAFDVIRQIAEQAGKDFQLVASEFGLAEAFGPDLSDSVHLVTSHAPIVVVPVPSGPAMLDFSKPTNSQYLGLF